MLRWMRMLMGLLLILSAWEKPPAQYGGYGWVAGVAGEEKPPGLDCPGARCSLRRRRAVQRTDGGCSFD